MRGVFDPCCLDERESSYAIVSFSFSHPFFNLALLVLFFVALALCQEATDYERQLKAKENEYMKVLELVEKYAAPPAPAAAPTVGGDSEVAALRAELAEMKRLRALDGAKLAALSRRKLKRFAPKDLE